MASTRLCRFARTTLSDYDSVLRQSPALIGSRTFANKSNSLGDTESEVKLNVPLKYMGSKAEVWRARQTRSGNYNDDIPWYQPYVISGSLAIFMIYFFILREENDVDKKFDKTLFDHIKGLEELQLEQALDYHRKNGLETKDLEERLEKIRGQ